MATKSGNYRVWNTSTSTWDLIMFSARDSDKLGGQLPSYYANATHKHSKSQITDFPTIPVVPTISTSITTDATSDAKTASPKAVKTYADSLVTNLGKIKIGDTWYTATLSGTTLTLS